MSNDLEGANSSCELSDSSSGQSEIVFTLREVFRTLDTNGDELLQECEIDRAISSCDHSDSSAQVVALLKICYEKLVRLSREGLLTQARGISMADMLVLESILSIESGAADQELESEIRKVASLMSQRTRTLSSHAPSLFGNSDPLKSVKPLAVRQGIMGSPLFLASLASVAATNPLSIVRMIREEDDGRLTITFPGALGEPVTIEHPGLLELALYSQVTRYGSWPCVLEKAYGALLGLRKGSTKLIPQDNLIGVEHLYEVLDLLTGQLGQWQYLPDFSDEELAAAIGSLWDDGRACVAATIMSRDGYTADAGIPSQHPFSVIGWDADRRRVKLRNPWGPRGRGVLVGRRVLPSSEPENEDGKPLDGIRDGIFSMSLGRFRRNFSSIYLEVFASEVEDRPVSPRKSWLRKLLRREN